MAVEIQGGAAQPVQTSNQAPSAGPAIPVAVVYDGRNVIAGPVQPIVEVTDGRMRLAGPAIPVVIGSGNGFTIAGAPIPVYVVSGVLQDALLLESGDFLLQEDDSYILLET